MKNIFKLLSVFTIFTVAVACGTANMNVKKVENVRPDFIPTMGKNQVLTIVAPESPNMKKEDFGDYSISSQKKAIELINSRNYFQVDGLSNPELNKLAQSKNYKVIKEKSGADSMLLITQPKKPPQVNCQLHTETRYRNGSCLKYNTTYKTRNDGTQVAQNTCVDWEQVPYTVTTSSITFRGKIDAELVNLNTGKKITANSKDVVMKTEDGAVCMGDNSGIRHKWEQYSGTHVSEVVHELTPVATNVVVQIHSTADGIPNTPENKELIKTVKTDLKGSIKLVKQGAEGDAKAIWEEIDKKTSGKSASASWNLAVYYWSNGEIENAKKFSDKSHNAGGEKWQKKISFNKKLIDEQYSSLRLR